MITLRRLSPEHLREAPWEGLDYYASNYRDFDGIIVPAKRRIYSYEGDYQPVMEPLPVKIDMGEITIQ